MFALSLPPASASTSNSSCEPTAPQAQTAPDTHPDQETETETEPENNTSTSTTTSSSSSAPLTKNQKRRARERAAKAANKATVVSANSASTSASTSASASTPTSPASSPPPAKQYTDQRIGMGQYAITVGETELQGKKRPVHTKMTMDSILARIIRAAPSLYEAQTPAQRLAHAHEQNSKNNHPRGTFALIYSSAQSGYELTQPTHDMVYHQANSPMIMDFKKTLAEAGQPLSQLASFDPTHSYHVLIVVVASDGNDIRRRELVVHVPNPSLALEPDPIPSSKRDSKQETAIS